MTADRPPGEPATEAGRDFLYDYQAFGPPSVRQFTDGILAIEAEARATAPLDMERLEIMDLLADLLRASGGMYRVDGRDEWHADYCSWRKTWAIGGDDEPLCVNVRMALDRHARLTEQPGADS